MAIDYRHKISIWELVVYLPCLIIAITVALQHGFNRSSGWLFLVLFTVVRIIGACCSLVTISHASNALYTATAMCMSVGLSPLILLLAGLLSRVHDSICHATTTRLTKFHFRIITLITITAIILFVFGSIHSNSSSDPLVVDPKSKIAIGLFLLTYAGLSFVFVAIHRQRYNIEPGESRLLLAVAISLPLLLVRLIYSVCAVFLTGTRFNPLIGDVTINLCMVVIEEFVIATTCLIVGLTLRKRPPRYDDSVYQNIELGTAPALPQRMTR